MVIGGWEKLSVELFNWKTGILIWKNMPPSLQNIFKNNRILFIFHHIIMYIKHFLWLYGYKYKWCLLLVIFQKLCSITLQLSWVCRSSNRPQCIVWIPSCRMQKFWPSVFRISNKYHNFKLSNFWTTINLNCQISELSNCRTFKLTPPNWAALFSDNFALRGIFI
jgi:hypothetical protein